MNPAQVVAHTEKNESGIKRGGEEQVDEEEEFEILKIEKQPKTLVGGQLRDYQLEGLNWLFKLY